MLKEIQHTLIVQIIDHKSDKKGAKLDSDPGYLDPQIPKHITNR